jgi:hypothetical protein
VTPLCDAEKTQKTKTKGKESEKKGISLLRAQKLHRQTK